MEEQNKKFMSHETLLNKYSEERLALNKLTLISDGWAYGHSNGWTRFVDLINNKTQH